MTIDNLQKLKYEDYGKEIEVPYNSGRATRYVIPVQRLQYYYGIQMGLDQVKIKIN